MELFRIFGSVFLKSDEAEQGLDDIEKKGEKTESKLSKALGGITKGAAVLGGAMLAAGGAGLAMANKFASTADEIDKTSMKMGISTDAFQELRFAMGQVGVGSATMDKALQRTNQRLGEAAAGNEKYQDALVNLGFSLDDVKNGTLDVDDVFMQSIDTLNKMENSQEAAALAGELFGVKTAQELMPAIEAGTLSIEELRAKAHELGGVISEDGVKAGVLWADTMDQFKNMMGGVFNTLAQNLLPIFQRFLEWIMEHMPQIQDTMQKVFDVIGTVISTGIEWIEKLIDWLKQWYEDNEETINAIRKGFEEFFDAVVNLIEGFVDLFTTIWNKYGEDILKFITNSWELIKAIFEGAFDLIVDIFNVFASLFKGDWEQLWRDVKTLASNLWDNIKSIIQEAIDTVVDTFASINLYETGKNIIQGLINGISNMIGAVKRKVQEVASAIGDKVTGFFGIQSPSRLMMNYGGHIGEGLAVGVEDSKSKVTQATESMSEGVVNPVRSSVQNASNNVQPTASKVEIPIYLNSKEIARATVNDISALLQNKVKMSMRGVGIT